MKTPGRNKFGGFTLIEAMIAAAVVTVVGLSIFYTLFSGMLLFTKNSAMNVSHEEARMALLQFQQDLHSAVSLPELTDSNANIYTSGTFTGPAAGVEFQVLISNTNYCQVTANANSGQSRVLVGIPTGYTTPYAGMRLIIPGYEIEQDVSAVSMSGTVATCTLSGTIGTTVTTSSNGTAYNVPCFFTQRVYYYVTAAPNVDPLVIDSAGDTAPALELNYIGVGRTRSYIMASAGMSDSTPFSIPTTISGAPNYKYVVAVNLSAQDLSTNSLITRFKFNTSSIMLAGKIPAYATLTTYQ
jgi:type II secretory pathway pseudopilin PulG